MSDASCTIHVEGIQMRRNILSVVSHENLVPWLKKSIKALPGIRH